MVPSPIKGVVDMALKAHTPNQVYSELIPMITDIQTDQTGVVLKAASVFCSGLLQPNSCALANNVSIGIAIYYISDRLEESITFQIFPCTPKISICYIVRLSHHIRYKYLP